jgi:hypothetical protein
MNPRSGGSSTAVEKVHSLVGDPLKRGNGGAKDACDHPEEGRAVVQDEGKILSTRGQTEYQPQAISAQCGYYLSSFPQTMSSYK